jgi:hypothetical protein
MLAQGNLIKPLHPIKPMQLINLAQMMPTIRQLALHVSVI